MDGAPAESFTLAVETLVPASVVPEVERLLNVSCFLRVPFVLWNNQHINAMFVAYSQC